VLDPRGILLGGAAPEVAQSQRLALEQDLARRALEVLTPWLGADRVSVQVTATLEDSETRQTVERVRNVVVAGQARPLEKTVRTTLVPEGRIQRVNAIVILGFDASADDSACRATGAPGAGAAAGARRHAECLCAACGGRQTAGQASRCSAPDAGAYPIPQCGRSARHRVRPALLTSALGAAAAAAEPARARHLRCCVPAARPLPKRRWPISMPELEAARSQVLGRSAGDRGCHQAVDAHMSQAGIEKSAALLLALGEEATGRRVPVT